MRLLAEDQNTNYIICGWNYYVYVNETMRINNVQMDDFWNGKCEYVLLHRFSFGVVRNEKKPTHSTCMIYLNMKMSNQ